MFAVRTPADVMRVSLRFHSSITTSFQGSLQANRLNNLTTFRQPIATSKLYGPNLEEEISLLCGILDRLGLMAAING